MQVISEIKKRPAGDASSRVDAATARLIEQISTARFDVTEALAELFAMNVTNAEILDFCIPNAAATLGQQWCDDHMSFADVSVGSARLHGMCRAVSQAWTAGVAAPGGLAILVAVCEGEDHFLGQSVIAAQLRRGGHSTRCLLGAKAEDIGDALHKDAYDAIMISCSGRVALETVAQTTKELRNEVRNLPTLIVGGAVLDYHDRVLEKTGADLVTKDLDLALSRLVANPFGALEMVAE